MLIREFERNLAENLRQEAKLKDSDVNRESAESSSIRLQDTLQAVETEAIAGSEANVGAEANVIETWEDLVY